MGPGCGACPVATRTFATASLTWLPLPRGRGATRTRACPNTLSSSISRSKRASASAALAKVSRYTTWGRPTCASTPYSRRRRSTMMSRWSSPMPRMMVWPVSASSPVRKVGSSSASLARPKSSFSFSAWVLGSMARAITGSRAAMRSSRMGALGRANGVAGARVLEAHRHHDGARARALDALAPVGMHREQTSDLFVAPGARVLHFVARFQHARVDAQVHRLAPFVHGYLEGQGAKGRSCRRRVG